MNGKAQHALSVRDLRLHRVLQRRPMGEMGRRGVPLRSRAGQEDAGRGRLSRTGSSSSSPTPRCPARSSWSISAPPIADMWTKIGVKVNAQALRMGLVRAAGARRSGAVWRAAPRCTAPSAGPTCRGATTARSARTATSTCSATRTTATRPARSSSKIYTDLLAERDPAKRTALTDRMVETGGRHLDRGADHRGHGLLRDQHRSRSASSRPSRAGTNSATCSSASRGPTQKPWKK